MGTCCGCWSMLVNEVKGKTRTSSSRTYRRAKYNEREYSIEFENLIEEEDFYAPPQHALSQVERDLLSKGKFDELFTHQKKQNSQQEEMLRQQEEDARLEDEAYIQAKKEASKVSKHKKQTPFDRSKLPNMREFNSVEFSKWLSEENIDITSPDFDIEDFDSFLEKMKAKTEQPSRGEPDVQNNWEQTMSRGLEATKIAGAALNALQPVDLHAVSIDTVDFHSDIDDQSYETNAKHELDNDVILPAVSYSNSMFSDNFINPQDGNTVSSFQENSPSLAVSRDKGNANNSFATKASVYTPPQSANIHLSCEENVSPLVINESISTESTQPQSSGACGTQPQPDSTSTHIMQSNNLTSNLIFSPVFPTGGDNTNLKMVENFNENNDSLTNQTSFKLVKTNQKEESDDEFLSDFDDFEGEFVSATSTGGFEDMI